MPSTVCASCSGACGGALTMFRPKQLELETSTVRTAATCCTLTTRVRHVSLNRPSPCWGGCTLLRWHSQALRTDRSMQCRQVDHSRGATPVYQQRDFCKSKRWRDRFEATHVRDPAAQEAFSPKSRRPSCPKPFLSAPPPHNIAITPRPARVFGVELDGGRANHLRPGVLSSLE